MLFKSIFPNFESFKTRLNFSILDNTVENTDQHFYTFLYNYYGSMDFIESDENRNVMKVRTLWIDIKNKYAKILKEQQKSINEIITSEALTKVYTGNNKDELDADFKELITNGSSNRFKPSIINVLGQVINLPDFYTLITKLYNPIFDYIKEVNNVLDGLELPVIREGVMRALGLDFKSFKDKAVSELNYKHNSGVENNTKDINTLKTTIQSNSNTILLLNNNISNHLIRITDLNTKINALNILTNTINNSLIDKVNKTTFDNQTLLYNQHIIRYLTHINSFSLHLKEFKEIKAKVDNLPPSTLTGNLKYNVPIFAVRLKQPTNTIGFNHANSSKHANLDLLVEIMKNNTEYMNDYPIDFNQSTSELQVNINFKKALPGGIYQLRILLNKSGEYWTDLTLSNSNLRAKFLYQHFSNTSDDSKTGKLWKKIEGSNNQKFLEASGKIVEIKINFSIRNSGAQWLFLDGTKSKSRSWESHGTHQIVHQGEIYDINGANIAGSGTFSFTITKRGGGSMFIDKETIFTLDEIVGG